MTAKKDEKITGLNLILTHEHADFDAMASLMAAWLLNPGYFAVRPVHLNRNVAVFLKEHRNEIPFHHRKHIPDEKASHILLVDTQKLFATTHLGSETKISVVDHHLPGAGLSPDWICRFEAYGACTSIFIPELKRRGVRLVPEVANLLLLGIYEDTGNLSYGSTTVADMKAATWLVEQGADLNVLQRYLHQPLTDNQMMLADRCLASMETLTIAGQEIVIASADATGIHDEYSTVAHHLRDMINPDAIFILLRSKAGLRIIGRATNDRINVGKLLKNFRGGGHARAAAALIAMETEEPTEPTMQSARDELVALLPMYVTPPITVGMIQSTGPLTLNATMKISEVAPIIQKYGYEGYPVVNASGEPVGLLNRRQVDHALFFEMDGPIDRIMDPGSFSVIESDSIDTVREIMNASGWGQIPVLDPHSGRVTGIVTRTDLLRTLPDSNRGGRRNIADALEKAISPGALTLIRAVSDVAVQFRFPIYIVGGFVRDLILGLPVKDFDIVIEGDAIKVAEHLVSRFGGTIRTHLQFGTAKWNVGDLKRRTGIPDDNQLFDGCPSLVDDSDIPDTLDLISARTEFYDYPTALPVIERSSIKLDLHRRDFTINTLALRLDGKYFGELIDFWGGMHDLSRGQIRTLHSLSFTDDPTRMIRAVRFEQRFGFQIEKKTLERLMLSADLLKRVSGQRILNEFHLLFAEKDPSACFERLSSLGLLRAIHPDLVRTDQHARDYQRMKDAEPDALWLDAEPELTALVEKWGGLIIWFGTEQEKTIEALCERLRIPMKIRAIIIGLSQLFHQWPMKALRARSEAVFFLEKLPVTSLYLYAVLCDEPATVAFFRNFLSDWRLRKPITNGNTLNALHLEKGPWISAVLERLRAGRIDDEITTETEEIAFRDRMIETLRRDGTIRPRK